MSKKIKLVIEVRREADKTYSISLENAKLKGDERYVDGLSEGYETDLAIIARTAGELVRDYLIKGTERADS